MTLSSDQLHVIRVYFRLPPEPGGMERHVEELSAAQRRLGVRVTLAYNSGEPDHDALQLWPRHDLLPISPALFRDLLFYGAAVLRAKEFPSGGVRIVHAHGDWSAFLCARMLGRVLGARAVAASLHETMRRKHSMYKWALRGCNPIFATGLEESRALEGALGRPVIHLPSAPSELFYGRPENRAETVDVLAVGSLIARKNFDLVLQCAARRRDLRFAIIGDGPDRPRLEAIRARENLSNVSLRGAAPAEQVHAALCAARLFISTATAEGSPTAALEAMACGLPVVLTPSNDYSRIVHQGINGIVTSTWHVEELIASIDEFLADPNRAIQAQKTSRTLAHHHRWDKKAQCVTNAMLAAVAQRMESK